MPVTALENGGKAVAVQPRDFASASQPRYSVNARSAYGSMWNYNGLSNKPCIESTELVGNRTLDEFGMGLASYQDIFDLFEEG